MKEICAIIRIFPAGPQHYYWPDSSRARVGHYSAVINPCNHLRRCTYIQLEWLMSHLSHQLGPDNIEEMRVKQG